MLDLKEHLKTMVEAHGPSGYEAPVREIIREAWRGFIDEMEQDGLGSLIGIKRAASPINPPRKIMLAAHMDEIGLIVREVVDGFLYVQSLGGIDNRLMLAQPVLVHGKRPLPGIIGTAPPHRLSAEERKNYPTMDALVVDVGLPAGEVAELVSIGDVITPDLPMMDLQGKRVASKAMDDRSCVAAITVCLDMLQSMQHQWDVYAVATVQEEMGLYGATTAAYQIQPDVAIALDVTFAQQPGVGDDDSIELGGGPGIGVGPNFHRQLNRELMDTAEYHEIKFQEEPTPRPGGTDAAAIQVSRTGVPTALVSIPVRNMHSPVEIICLSDLANAAKLVAETVARIDGEVDFTPM